MRVRLMPFLTLLVCASPGINTAFAQATCTVDGSPAYCIDPEVGPYTYQVSDGFTSARAATEAEAIDGYKAAFKQSHQNANIPVCTLTMVDNLPPWQPTRSGTGWTKQGDYGAALGGVGQYWDLYWKFGTEYQAQRIPLVRTATYTRYDDPTPCQQTDGPKGVYVYRQREVSCPAWPFWPAGNEYCFRGLSSHDPVKNRGLQCPMTPNPVNVATGNKFRAESDYTGSGAMPLQFVRYYNSKMSNTSTSYRSGFGPNWRSTYERAIRFSDGANFPTAFANRPDGRVLYFRFSNGQFTADADIADRLERLTDASGNAIGWRYAVAATEEVETYDSVGRLTAITTRSGLAQSLAYDSNGRLSTISDSFGRTLQLAYDANNRVRTLPIQAAKSIHTPTTAMGMSIP